MNQVLLNRVFRWQMAITIGIQDPIWGPVQRWIETHPTIAWILAHPLWSIGLGLIGLLLIWSLLKAILQFTEQALLSLLKLPLRLTQRLFGILFGIFKPAPPAIDEARNNPSSENTSPHLTDLIERLEAIRKEQDEILQQIKTALVTESRNEKV